MAKKRPLIREQHIQLNKWAIECGAFMEDAAELLWNTYGVSSKIGRLAETAQKVCSHLRVLLADHAYDAELSRDDWGPHRARSEESKNRFTFEGVGRGRKLPGRMDVAQHQKLGTGLKFHRETALTTYVTYATAYSRTDLAAKELEKAAKTLGNLRCELDDQVFFDCKDQASEQELMRIYYGQDEPERWRPLANLQPAQGDRDRQQFCVEFGTTPIDKIECLGLIGLGFTDSLYKLYIRCDQRSWWLFERDVNRAKLDLTEFQAPPKPSVAFPSQNVIHGPLSLLVSLTCDPSSPGLVWGLALSKARVEAAGQ